MYNNEYGFLETKAWELIKKELDNYPIEKKPESDGYFVGRLHIVHFPSRELTIINDKKVHPLLYRHINNYLRKKNNGKQIIDDCKHLEEILK